MNRDVSLEDTGNRLAVAIVASMCHCYQATTKFRQNTFLAKLETHGPDTPWAQLAEFTLHVCMFVIF